METILCEIILIVFVLYYCYRYLIGVVVLLLKLLCCGGFVADLCKGLPHISQSRANCPFMNIQV